MSINIERLKEIVIEKGISYTQLAEMTGVSKTQISRLISGNVDKVRPTTISKLSIALGVSYKEIYIKEESKSEWCW